MASETLPERPAPIELPSLPAPVKEFIPYLSQNSTKHISTIVGPYKAYESELRKVYAQQPDHEAVKDGAVNLVPIFSGHESDLKTNFNLFSESSLADLDWNNVVAAGSAVTTSLIPLPEKWAGSKRAMREYYHQHLAPASDVDLFLYGLTEAEGLEKIKQIETSIKDAILHETTTIRTKNAITIATTEVFEVHWPMLDRSRLDPTIFERSFGRTEGLARLLILEKLPKTADREDYMDQRRKERGRPSLNRGFRSQRRLYGNLKDEEEDEVADWAEQDEIANYHTMTVPYGPKYNAAKINRLLYAKDLLLNAEWNQDKDREVYLHRHPCFFGTAEEVIQDCCGFCPVPTTDEEKEVAEKESKNNVSGTLKFITDDPGRQEIGSFNPINDDEWTTMSYVGDTARLCQAIVDGDIEHVQDWCSQEGVDVNRRDFTGRTPLHLATMTSTPEIVKCLVDHGARMIARLSLANEEEEDEKASRKLTRIGADPEESSDSASEITLDSEQEESDAMTMGSFVKIPANKGEDKDDATAVMDDTMEDPDIYDINVIAWDYGLSPLHLAILNGHLEAIKLLVSEYGADVLFPVKLVEAGTTNPRGAIMTLVLAMSLPNEKSKQVVELLLRLGATSAQSDMNHFTALHYIVAQNNIDLLDVLFNHDRPAAQKVLNKIGLAKGYGQADTPLSTAIKRSHGEMTSRLLQLGARPEVNFENWVKVYMSMNSHAKSQTTEANMEKFQTTVQQPIIAAICKGMGTIVGDLIAHGANPQTLTTIAWSAVNNPQQRQDNPDADKPEILRDEAFYTASLEPGSYKYWTALQDYRKESYENKLKHEQYEKSLKDRETQLAKYKGQREAIQEAIKDLEQAEQVLVAAGAKPFSELYPDIPPPEDRQGRSWGHKRGERVKPAPYKTHLTFNVPDLSDGMRQGYLRLFEAAWHNDLETVKHLTLGPWQQDNAEYAPLKIAVRDQNDFMPFSLAVLRGHFSLARRIVEICLAQYHDDDESEQGRHRWGITVDDSDDESEELPIFSELVTDKFTIDNLEEVSTVVKGDVLPLTMIGRRCTSHRFIDNHASDRLDETLTLFEHAVRCYNIRREIFNEALSRGRTTMLAEMIRCCGAGVPWGELVSASGVELKTKPRYYEGLTIGGKKRKDWAQRPGQFEDPNEFERRFPPLLEAAHMGSIDSVEWFMSDAPMRRFKEFADSNQNDIRIRSLEHGKGFDKVVSKWLNKNSELLLHVAILYNRGQSMTSRGDGITEEVVSRLDSIIKLFHKKDVQEMSLERADVYPSALTPLALWMSQHPHHDQTEILEVLLKYSTGEELEMINGEGDLPLHVAIKGNQSNLTSFLLSQKPALLYRESATGRTPLEMSHDHYISNFLSRPPSTDAHWQYHSVTRDINELIAYHWKEKKRCGGA
ncbi:hypothetical protein EYC84_007581 [Monilinia fructicola]|uniref:Ankyrin repeat protein n=1 Tax=Monilinia fructicola TaxID=38448 RepID=A0A5M9JJM1_MONFR|nr:hypothetical protein EYC84_007581 [Monilinia fructicola]